MIQVSLVTLVQPHKFELEFDSSVTQTIINGDTELNGNSHIGIFLLRFFSI